MRASSPAIRHCRRVPVAIVACLSLVSTCLSAVEPSAEVAAWSESQRISYLMGLQISGRVHALHLDPVMLQRGIADGIAQRMPAIFVDPRQLNELFSRYQQQQLAAIQLREAAAWREAAGIPAAGPEYFTLLAARPGVTVTTSGLAYEVLKAADGAKPALQQTVVVSYTGRLLDGSIFDSSAFRGQPAAFPLQPGGLIAGWIEGMQLMPIGSSWRFHIPAALAYGERGQPPTIPADATLIFDITLHAAR